MGTARRNPPLWCEARCHYLYDEAVIGCCETAPGAFGVTAATRMAKDAGWRVVRGEWCCPVCYERIAKEL